MSRLTPEREADIEAAFDTSQYWVEGDEVFAELRALRAELAEATAERDRLVQRDSCLLADAADAMGIVRKSDGAPLVLSWTQALLEMRELRESRDESDGEAIELGSGLSRA